MSASAAVKLSDVFLKINQASATQTLVSRIKSLLVLVFSWDLTLKKRISNDISFNVRSTRFRLN